MALYKSCIIIFIIPEISFVP